jgi:hypothetical protein
MKRLAWYEMDDEDRRVAGAQTIVWLACLGPLLGLVAAVVGLLFGNRALIAALAEHPIGVLLGVAWVGIYALAGYLIGERRAEGGVIGLILFAYALVQNAVYGRLLSLGAAFALLGIVLILRAGRALRLPFWPK